MKLYKITDEHDHYCDQCEWWDDPGCWIGKTTDGPCDTCTENTADAATKAAKAAKADLDLVEIAYEAMKEPQ